MAPVAIAVPQLWLTGDINAALAGFLAVGISVLGCLWFGWRWWPPYFVIASAVALVLLLAPDAYAAFGLLFLAIGAGIAIGMSDTWLGAVSHLTVKASLPARVAGEPMASGGNSATPLELGSRHAAGEGVPRR